MKLIICEKPSLANLVAEALGGGSKSTGFISVGDYRITWCFGHMLEFIEPEKIHPSYKKWVMNDLPLRLPLESPIMQPIEANKAHYKTISALLKDADKVIHCGDPDEEGQLIIDEILAFENYHKTAKRLLINNMNLDAAKTALNNLKNNDDTFINLGRSALARSISDSYYGLNLTRFFTLKGREAGYDGVLSVGRVQSAMLGMIYKRTLANQSHHKMYYYDIRGQFDGVVAKYQPSETDPTDEKGRITSESLAGSLSIGASSVTRATHQEVSRKAPMPHSLASLQSEASKVLGMKSDRTLVVLQSLYEKHKLVTYPRSDCRYLGDENFSVASDTLASAKQVLGLLGDAIPTDIDTARKHKAFNTDKVTAHTAIIPTEARPESVALSTEEEGLYKIIARAFVALFLPDAYYAVSDIDIQCQDDKWHCHKEQLISSGYLSYLNDTDEALNPDAINPLEKIQTGDALTLRSIDNTRKETKPPRLYTESTFIKDLTRASNFIEDTELKKAMQARFKDADEIGGIGTPATRSSILAGLYTRGFLHDVSVKGYKEMTIQPTTLGTEFVEALPTNLIEIDTTAQWAMTQSLIAKGEQSVNTLTHSVGAFVDALINEGRHTPLNMTDTRPSCPTCKSGKLSKRKGKFGDFWGCSSYPECKALFKDNKGQPNLTPKPAKPDVSTEHHCPNCEKGMVRRKGKKGFFWGCSGFPECKTMAFDDKGTPKFKTASH